MFERNLDNLIDKKATSITLYWITKKEELLAYETIRFERGYAELCRALNIFRLSGRIEVGGDIKNHFLDLTDDSGNLVGTVALDYGSFKTLKYKLRPIRNKAA